MVCSNKNTFFPLSCHHGSIYDENFGSENSTGIRNGDCNPRNGWGRQFDPKSAGLLKVEAAWPCWSLLLKSLPLLYYQIERPVPRVLVFSGAMDSS